MAARNLPSRKWTIVQHSGYGYGADPLFARGLESRVVTTVAEARRVEAAGGELFDSYNAAEDFVERASYPDGYGGLIPQAQGAFSEVLFDDLAIYIPIRQAVG